MVLCINRVSNFLPPRFTRKFLWKFICKPDHIWKQIRIYLITHAYPTSPLPKMSVSLAYWRLVSEMDEHPGRPSNSCALLAFSNILLGSFATSMKIKGERGSSYLTPSANNFFSSFSIGHNLHSSGPQPLGDPHLPPLAKASCSKHLLNTFPVHHIISFLKV